MLLSGWADQMPMLFCRNKWKEMKRGLLRNQFQLAHPNIEARKNMRQLLYDLKELSLVKNGPDATAEYEEKKQKYKKMWLMSYEVLGVSEEV